MLSITRINNFQTINRNSQVQKNNRTQTAFAGKTEDLEQSARIIAKHLVNEPKEENSAAHHARIQQFLKDGGTMQQVGEACFNTLSAITTMLSHRLQKQQYIFRINHDNGNSIKTSNLVQSLNILNEHINGIGEHTKDSMSIF